VVLAEELAAGVGQGDDAPQEIPVVEGELSVVQLRQRLIDARSRGVPCAFLPGLGEGSEDRLPVVEVAGNPGRLLLGGIGDAVPVLILPADDPLLGAAAEGIVAVGQLPRGDSERGGGAASGLAGVQNLRKFISSTTSRFEIRSGATLAELRVV
jgi:hypothetical protein